MRMGLNPFLQTEVNKLGERIKSVFSGSAKSIQRMGLSLFLFD